MLDTLLSKFITDADHPERTEVRQQYAKFTSTVGIFMNLFLFGIKITAGIWSGAIAIIADALNNLSDAGSAIVLLFGFRMADKPADDEHPFGHGRIEYLTGLFLSVVIIVVGFELMKTSVEKVLHPEELSIDWVSGGVLVASIIIKLMLGSFYKLVGNRIDSEAIKAAALDSLTDCLSTSVVLVSLIVYVYSGYNIDGEAGVVVSLVILASGWQAVKDVMQPLLGEPTSPELVQQVKRMVLTTPHILGLHDLIVHSYGHGTSFVSLHAEIDASTSLVEAHLIVDGIEERLEKELGIAVVVHIDPIDINNPETNRLHVLASRAVAQVEAGLSLHDFQMLTKEGIKEIVFEVDVPASMERSDAELEEAILLNLRQTAAEYNVKIKFDHQYC